MDEELTSEENKQNSNWLQRVSEQSWEPELLISGLAVYATLQLPDLVRKFYQYYQFNFQADTGIVDELLPLMVVGVFLMALQVLSMAFIFHFVVRAFWVGLVGLNSVFKDGINYDKLEYSEIYKSEMKKRIGNKDDFLLATDRLASVVFSQAFLFVFYLIGIGFLYLVFFLLINVVKLMVSEEVFDLYSKIIMSITLIAIIGVAIVSVVLNLKRFRNIERYAKLHFKLNWYVGNIFYPYLLKPIQYLVFIFMSNIPTKTFQKSSIIVMVCVLGLMMKNTFDLMETNLIESRDFYSERSSINTYDSNEYESEFEGEMISDPIIEKPMIKTSEYISMFIPYSKLLDMKLNAFCDVEEPDEMLNRYEKRKELNGSNIECINRFFTFVVNDKDTLASDLLFTKHPKTDQKGYRTFLALPDSIPLGKNLLSIKRDVFDNEDANRDSLGRGLIFESEIPFWITH